MSDEENAYSFTTRATQLTRLSRFEKEGFPMRRGGRLKEVDLAYETWGSLSPEADNAILIFTGLSPSAHAASSQHDSSPGWWEYMVGEGKAIDTTKFFVICVNSLGGCHGSTGPTSIDLETGRAFGSDFPDLTIEDIASAGYELVGELGIKRLHAAVGSSMGGMASMAYAMLYPDALNYLISISAALQALPLTIAIRSLQREIIRSDPAWNNGHYETQDQPLLGMALARKLGLVSYRAANEWNSKFDRSRLPPEKLSGKPFELEFEIENYLEYNAQKFIESFDANSYQYLSRSMDWFDVAEHGETIESALAKITVKKVLLMGVTTDVLFPLVQQQEIADKMLAAGLNVQFETIDSGNGHDAFLVDGEQFSPIMKNFLNECCLQTGD